MIVYRPCVPRAGNRAATPTCFLLAFQAVTDYLRVRRRQFWKFQDKSSPDKDMARFTFSTLTLLLLLMASHDAPIVRALAAIELATGRDDQREPKDAHGATVVRPAMLGVLPPPPPAPPAASRVTGIAGMHVIGQPILIFDHLVDKREPNHLPDLPANAWKESDGTVNVTITHFENYRMRGPDLEHLVSFPNKIFSSTSSASEIGESHYNYHHWLAAPYTFDGRTIYALTHSEWYACLLIGDCATTTAPTSTSTGSYQLNSWANTLTSFVSTDGGATWTANGADEGHVVSNESFTWTGSNALASALYRKALNHSGMMNPTRLVKEGNFFYSIAFLNHRDFNRIDTATGQAPIDKYDYVLIRTGDPTRASGWEGWRSGSQYVPLATHAFTAFMPRRASRQLNAGGAQLIYDVNARLYIALFVTWGAAGPAYYMTTPSLADPQWSDAEPIDGTQDLQLNPRSAANCSTGFQANNYVSLIDTHSDGLNFEFTDGDPWLFYVFNPALRCDGQNLNRDLLRVKLAIDYKQ